MTVVYIVLTIAVYLGARLLSIRFSSPLTTPVFTSTAAIIIVFLAGDVSYEEYIPAKNIMTFLLGPATVALAVPLYHNRAVLMERFLPAFIGITVGTMATIASAVWLSAAFGLSETIQAAAAVKAVTTPVAIEAAAIIGGDPALAAAFVMTAGIFGAVFGPPLLTIFRMKDPFSRGLAVGTVSHGIGTSQAVLEGPVQGAVSSAAMGFASIITALILPWFFPLL
ncbi:LrgB family protein [Domibacillus indicus]|uniref:LrgB family protein n=1 Tax=Domibacillus indicus TaxID=1437523 RepID=UPI0006180ACE|nr:LrgB family protein [Domibacillus indicus]